MYDSPVMIFATVVGFYAVLFGIVFGVKALYKNKVPADVQAAITRGNKALDRGFDALFFAVLKWAAIAIGVLICFAIPLIGWIVLIFALMHMLDGLRFGPSQSEIAQAVETGINNAKRGY